MRPLEGSTDDFGPLCIVPRTWTVSDTESALHQNVDEGEGLVALQLYESCNCTSSPATCPTFLPFISSALKIALTVNNEAQPY